MLPLEHSAILLTCIKRLLVIKTNFWYFSEQPFYTGFTVQLKEYLPCKISSGRTEKEEQKLLISDFTMVRCYPAGISSFLKNVICLVCL